MARQAVVLSRGVAASARIQAAPCLGDNLDPIGVALAYDLATVMVVRYWPR
jgi:hypothetical protein